MTIKSNSSGFTLAEVLITLGIIGVVAALTLPNLITQYQKNATVQGLKVAYSLLSQAVQKSISENGEIYNLKTKKIMKTYLDKYGYKRVGIFNSGKAMQAMIVSPSFEDTKIAELLYENPITGEIRVKYQDKLLKYKDLVDMMTPKAKESLKAKNMKELLRAAGFIKGSNKITPGKMLGSVDDLIKYLTEEQC